MANIFWHSIWHSFWHCIWRIFCHSVVRVQARSTASWARDMAVGSRHPDLAAWHSGRAALHCIHSRRGRREGEEEEEGVALLLKSRNLHLAGGEKELKIEVLFCFQMYCFVEVWGYKKWHNVFNIQGNYMQGGGKNFKHHSRCQVGLICWMYCLVGSRGG